MSSGERMSSGVPPSATAAVECGFCGKITGYKAVPGSPEEHHGYLDCLRALQTRLDGLLSGLATAASKERATRSSVDANPR
jgi:hypothetical protein